MEFQICSINSHKLHNNPRMIASYRTHLHNLELASSSTASTQTLMHAKSPKLVMIQAKGVCE